MPAEFDTRDHTDANVVHAGPIFEESETDLFDPLPWEADDPTPLVVVGLSSTYMRQESLFERILTGLSALPAHVLATTGPELDPAEVRAPEGVCLRRYIPHSALLPQAALVVTHAGTGTLMAAGTAGVPCVCVPLGRDQPYNAARAAELGIAIALPSDASSNQIKSAATEALASSALRSKAEQFSAAVAAYGQGMLASRALEELAAGPA
ncbi:MAG: glycosyltransferase [Gaiellaceae bacterium]